jgi:hypothetical protein
MAIEKGNKFAMNNLAIFFENIKGDLISAEMYYKMAVDNGNDTAMLNLAVLYEDVKKDFETWSKFLNDDGVVLLHDTCIESLNGNEYGVKKFFEELEIIKSLL